MTGLPIDPDDPNTRLAFTTILTRVVGVRPREAEVCYHLVRGVPGNEALAALMCVQVRTVKGFLWCAMKAIGARDRTHAVLKLWPIYVRARRQGAAIAPLIAQEGA